MSEAATFLTAYLGRWKRTQPTLHWSHPAYEQVKVQIAPTMSPSTAVIPRFLLPQLSWKASSPSCLAAASRIHPSTRGSEFCNKTIHRSLSSSTRSCIHARHALSPLIPYRQDPPFVRYSHLALCYRQCFSTTPVMSRDHHFDTLKFVQRLKDEGFSEEQSKAMMLVLSDVIEESIQNLTRTMVLREGLQISSLEHVPIHY